MPGALLPSQMNSVAPERGSDGPPPDFFEGLKLGSRVAIDKTSDAQKLRRLDEYGAIVDTLAELGHEPANFKKGSQFVDVAFGYGFNITDKSYDRHKIWTAIESERKRNPKAFSALNVGSADQLDQWILSRHGARQSELKQLKNGGFGSGAGEFLADAVTDMGDSDLGPLQFMVGFGGKSVAQVALREAIFATGEEVFRQPERIRNRANLGESTSAEQVMMDLGSTFVFAGVLGGGAYGIGKNWDNIIARPKAVQEKAWAGIVDRVPGLRDKLGSTVDWDALDPHLPDIAEVMIAPERMADADRGAITALRQDAAIEAGNPFIPDGAGRASHYRLLGETMQGIMDGAPAYVPKARPSIAARLRGGTSIASGVTGDAMATVKARIGVVESGGRANAKNPRSSAMGLYQFTDGTWLAYYKRRFGMEGLTREQIIAKKGDTGLQNILMDDLLSDNMHSLKNGGHATDAGNLYLAHFAGQRGAARLLEADPNTPVHVVLGQKAVTANPFLKGKSAADVIAWAHQKMGGPAPTRSKANPARAAEDVLGALDRELADTRAQLAELDNADGGARGIGDVAEDLADEIAVPLADAVPIPRVEGVGRLNGPTSSAQVLGLTDDARAILPELQRIVESERSVSLNKSAPLAELLGVDERNLKSALQQMAIQGLVVQNAKGNFMRLPRMKSGPQDVFSFIAERGGLSDDGFSQAQRARNLVMDNPPRGHDLGTIFEVEREVQWKRKPDANGQGGVKLAKPFRTTRPALIPGKGPLVRKSGMGVDEMGEALWEAGYFGAPDVTPRPSENEVLELLQNAWGSGKKVYSLDDAGEVAARAMEAPELADKNNPFLSSFQSEEHYNFEFNNFDAVAKDAFGLQLDDEGFAAAYRLWQDGENGDIASALLSMVQRDLEDVQAREIAERGMSDAADIIEEWEAAIRSDGIASAEEIPSGRFDPADADANEPPRGYAGREEAGPIEPDSWRSWDDPDGPAARVTTESMEHDARALTGRTDPAEPNALDAGAGVDPAIAARQAQEAQLRAEAPLRGENATGQEQDGAYSSDPTRPTLFDAADQPTFRLEEEGDAVSAADLLDEFEQDAAFIKTVRDCL